MNKKRRLIIYGTDDFPQLAKFYFDEDSEYEVSGFTVDEAYKKTDDFCGLPVVSSDDMEKRFPPDEYSLFIAIAYSHLNEIREAKYFEMKKRGYSLASYMSSKATIWNEGNKIGDNCFILEDNTIQPYATIGNDTILWSGNHIGHHATIGDHVFISSHVVLSGRASVGHNAFIGVNATINDHINVAAKTVIGSGALITRDTEPNSLYKNDRTKRDERDVMELDYFHNSDMQSK